MKRKQVMALLLCGTLTFGAVPSVMAADVEETENIVSTETLPEKAVTEETVSKETNEVVAEEVKEKTKKKEAANPPEDYFISDAMLTKMSENLTALIEQLSVKYAGLDEKYGEYSQDIKDLLEKQMKANGFGDFAAEITDLKADVEKSVLEEIVAAANGNTAEADWLLEDYEIKIVAKIDAIKEIMKEIELYVDDYREYVQSYVDRITGMLHAALYKDRNPEYYTQEFIAQVQAYFEQAEQIRVPEDIVNRPEEQEKIFQFAEEVYAYLSRTDCYSTRVLEEGKKAAQAYKAFGEQIPQRIWDKKVFDGYSGKVTYKEVADYADKVSEAADRLLNDFANITFDDLYEFDHRGYGNLVAAYNGGAAAILEDLKELTAVAEISGYEGSEKAAYQTALKNYNGVVAGSAYEKYADAAAKLKDTAEKYADAAEKYIKEDGKKQIESIQSRLEVIQKEISEYKEYYNDTYPSEVETMLKEVTAANVDNMEGKDILDLLKKANGVLEKQSAGYSEKVAELRENVQKETAGAGAWWTYLSDEMKSDAAFAEAIALTGQYGKLAEGENGIYDIGSLVNAYQDLQDKEGKIQSAEKEIAGYLVDKAEKVYKEESAKQHKPELVKAYREQIDALKGMIVNWDSENARTEAGKLVAAETELLKDKPVVDKEDDQKPQEGPDLPKEPSGAPKDDTQKETEPKETTPVKTGDESNAAVPGLLALFSLAGIADILAKRRK